ncbi:GDSL-type esterase/lipase family protein [Pedobacter glucosidilyticus]|uniref:GDSL-type esterase/lipase family protein n=1 Tax=Pedobacter glucosidilyticus TaxID=1122941 RepID=UPI0026F20CF3|nr:GDSL-type esterase/lipase family protein [Pedobacter glucosidilyticus]
MKKLLFFSLALFFFASHSNAQAVKWDTTYRPNNFELKVELFKSYPNASTDIIFLGNSITAGVDWVELLGNPNIKNRGISGDISYGVLERLSEVTEGKPAKVFLLIGINDISRNIPDSLIINNYHRIVKQIKKESPTTKIYLQTVFPVNNTFTQFKNHYNKDEHITAVNAGLKKLAAEEKATLIDTHKIFLDADGRMKKDYTHDGLHLKASGYAVWAQLLKQYL